MAKSKRSKVKMAYKAMRRSVLEEKHDAELREQAARVYKAVGLELPPERSPAARMQPRMHGGTELVSTFVPTPKGPVLNVVHGPTAVDKTKMSIPKEVIGLPIVGAGARARVRSGSGKRAMDVEGEFEEAERPFLYPRREKKRGGGIRKKRRKEAGKGVKAVRKEGKAMKVA